MNLCQVHSVLNMYLEKKKKKTYSQVNNGWTVPISAYNSSSSSIVCMPKSYTLLHMLKFITNTQITFKEVAFWFNRNRPHSWILGTWISMHRFHSQNFKGHFEFLSYGLINFSAFETINIRSIWSHHVGVIGRLMAICPSYGIMSILWEF